MIDTDASIAARNKWRAEYDALNPFGDRQHFVRFTAKGKAHRLFGSNVFEDFEGKKWFTVHTLCGKAGLIGRDCEVASDNDPRCRKCSPS